MLRGCVGLDGGGGVRCEGGCVKEGGKTGGEVGEGMTAGTVRGTEEWVGGKRREGRGSGVWVKVVVKERQTVKGGPGGVSGQREERGWVGWRGVCGGGRGGGGSMIKMERELKLQSSGFK